MNNITSLLEKIENAKALDFENIFSESFELYKKTWLQGVLFVILKTLIMLPLIIVFYVPLVGIMFAQQDNYYDDSAALIDFFGSMSLLYILFVVVAFFVLGAVYFAINASFYRIMRKLDLNEVVTTQDFFHFVKTKYLSKAFVLMLAGTVISFISVFLCFIPIIYMIVPLSFFGIIFAFNPDITSEGVIKTSFKLGHKNWLIAFGLIIVSHIISQIVGYLTCGIGYLFTAILVYHPIYLIYKKVIGFSETSAIEEIGTQVE